MKYIMSILFTGLIMYGTQSNHLIDQDLITYQYLEIVTNEVVDSHIDQPITTAFPINPFDNFIQYLMKLINPENTNTNIKVVENMISNLIRTALQLIKINMFNPDLDQDQLRIHLNNMDPLMRQFLTDLITKRAHAFTFKTMPNAPMNNHQSTNKPDETTQKVLGNFALIVQNFFNIVQDPENPDNVAPNVIGMLAGIVTIGTEVITRGLALDADESTISAFVALFDQAEKENFYHIAQEATHNNDH